MHPLPKSEDIPISSENAKVMIPKKLQLAFIRNQLDCELPWEYVKEAPVTGLSWMVGWLGGGVRKSISWAERWTFTLILRPPQVLHSLLCLSFSKTFVAIVDSGVDDLRPSLRSVDSCGLQKAHFLIFTWNREKHMSWRTGGKLARVPRSCSMSPCRTQKQASVKRNLGPWRWPLVGVRSNLEEGGSSSSEMKRGISELD